MYMYIQYIFPIHTYMSISGKLKVKLNLKWLVSFYVSARCTPPLSYVHRTYNKQNNNNYYARVYIPYSSVRERM